MRPAILHLDEANASQPHLVARCKAAGGIEIEGRMLGPQIRLWAQGRTFDAFHACLEGSAPPAIGPLLTFTGSGDFHHVSYALIERTIAQTKRRLTVLHVDNHPDWVRFRRGLHCGSWAAKASRMAGVNQVITLGPCSGDLVQPWRKGADLALVRRRHIALYPWKAPDRRAAMTIAGVHCPTMTGIPEDEFFDRLVAGIKTQDIYLTIDKDVLRRSDAATNWDQGDMPLEYLLRFIDRIGRSHTIAGADICGDVSQPVYGGKRLTRWLKQGEALLDQPRTRTIAPADHALNERTNIALLDAILAAA